MSELINRAGFTADGDSRADRRQTPFYRLLLVSNRNPISTCNLAKRIDRQLSGAKISGIILKAPRADTRWLRILLQRAIDLVIGIVHASPAKPEGTAESELADFLQECHRRDWPLIVQEDFVTPEASAFMQNHPADLALLIGAPHLPADVLPLFPHGSLLVEITPLSPDAATAASGEVCITIQSTQVANASPSSVSARLPVQPRDTPRTIALKAELISNDLLLQMVSSYSTGNIDRAPEEANAWQKRMLPQHRPSTGCPPGHSEIATTRPLWKMCLHTLALVSPYVILRNWYRRARGQFPVVVLFHHLVSDRPHRMGMPTETFLRQVQFLQRYYRVISLSEALKELRAGSVKAPTVVLTFDDVYEDNFLCLRAILEQTGVPATLFICPEIVTGHKEFQHDQEDGQTGFPSLGWEQARYWQSETIEFGSHTRSHFDCGSSVRPTLEEEIVGSRNEIESHMGKPVRFFAFPWGKSASMSSAAKEIATSAYECCFSTMEHEILPMQQGTKSTVSGRKFLVANAWNLEVDLQSVFER
jgi:peptidoglycan/xylan/chitin deacetylase (PgdA/CDA1 family)